MSNLIIGLGVQGKKRIQSLKNKKYLTIDPYNKNADFSRLSDVDLSKVTHAYICTPETQKYKNIKKLLLNDINVLVEKPLILNKKEEKQIDQLLKRKRTLYTAYNHRFEPHIVKVKKLLKQKKIGKIYNVNLYYGNGTAKLWKNNWREKKKYSILHDLGVHLLDIFDYWFDFYPKKFKKNIEQCNELKCIDFLSFSSTEKFSTNFTTSIINWRNTFKADILGSRGSIHIDCLCKWGPSILTYRKRKLPSGKPLEKKITINSKDPTWNEEEKYFKKISKQKKNNFSNNIMIKKSIESIIK